MTELWLCSDLHLSDKSPTNCSSNYNVDLFTMLWEIVAEADAWRPDAFVIAGDLFHSKVPSRTSHKTVQQMIDVIQAFPCPVYLIVGNHDVQHDRIDSIHETQPFGVLLKSGARLLNGWAEGGELPLYGVPWMQDWNGDYSGDFIDWITEVDTRHDGNALLVTHAPIYPPGQELQWEHVLASHVAGTMGNVGHCYYGHVHDNHGIYSVDGVTFCNHGALSRGSLQESDVTRRPAFTIWRSGQEVADAFTRVELKTARPAEEVFRIAEAVERVDYRDRLEAFLSAIGSSQVSISSIESVLSHVRSMDLSDSEIRLAEEVLTAATQGELK